MITLAGPCSHEVEIKKSRFLARGWPVASAAEASQLLEQQNDPGATHNCWAWRLGQESRSSDDGEPKGTAGRPILAAIERQGLDGVAVLVTRWFGGIKLGAGGLARAYGGAASEALRLADKREIKPLARARFGAPFDLLSLVHLVLERRGARKVAEEFSGEGARMEIELPADALAQLRLELREASAGRIELEE